MSGYDVAVMMLALFVAGVWWRLAKWEEQWNTDKGVNDDRND